MANKEHNKFLLPVEISRHQPYSWLKVNIFEYKLFTNSNEQKHSTIRFLDINGFIIGEHMPIKLQTIYDKAAVQVKNTTAKAVTEIKQVADITISTANEIKGDVSSTAKQVVTLTSGLFSKVKTAALKSFKNKKDSNDQ